jgi:ketosteroid isomerase-like protein
MARQENLDRIKAGYVAWHERKGDALDVWRPLMAENFTLVSMDESTPGLSFAVDRHSREEALAYLKGIFDHWEMIHYTPETFVADDDNVAMFGKCSYRNKKTGKAVECRIANRWKFEDGKAVAMTDVWDTALAAAAAT